MSWAVLQVLIAIGWRDPCDFEPRPELEPAIIAPAPGEIGVPLDVQIWARADAASSVLIYQPPGDRVIFTRAHLVLTHEFESFFRFEPLERLAPNTRYNVTMQQASTSFVTGTSTHSVAPPMPVVTTVTATDAGSGCSKVVRLRVSVEESAEPLLLLARVDGAGRGLGASPWVFVPGPAGGGRVAGTVVAVDLAGNESLPAPFEGSTPEPPTPPTYREPGGCATTPASAWVALLIVLAGSSGRRTSRVTRRAR